MRKAGGLMAIAAVAAIAFSPTPAAAFGLRFGPFSVHLPFYFPRLGHHRLYMHANPNDMARPGQPQQPGVTAALLYPNQALPAVFQSVFWPSHSPAWPFGYQDIFSTAFATMPAGADQPECQPSVNADQIVGRIRDEVSPTADQMQLLQKLGGALGAAGGYLAKSCPNEIPAQPVARLQLMESQIEELAMAIDIVRQPLQDFEQSLNSAQEAKFAAIGAAPPAAGRPNQTDSSVSTCGGSLTAIDWSIDQIDKAVQPTDAQRDDLATLKQSFGKAASDLEAHCLTSVPRTAVGRLETIEARLDATWRSELSIQVALANFETKLSDAQKDRFDQMNFAAQ
jgi:hypothetical protein